ncbi:fimbrial biogenesis chaperone [Budvicia diplopodorum]|uniref:fimbrial biogenesis chaperone n=1 Tax=Budvicia diplopodorum TaxID=1119056 RepID=UPI0013568E3F|nr:molecular chaperone [Budvicia diplopodorum]
MRTLITSLLLVILFSNNIATAGVIIEGTRIVYPEGNKEVNIVLDNQDKSPFLIKTWIENTDFKDSHFLITPPLFRLDSKQKSTVRIFKTNNSLPTDRESLFYFNAMSIPSADTSKENTLQIAIRSRLKFFYRPKMLNEQYPEDVTDKLSWQNVNGKLSISNPTPYYMNFSYISVAGKKIQDANLAAPLSTTELTLPDGVSVGEIEWKIINDMGGIGPVHKAKL